MYYLGVDTGGTFTDFVLLSDRDREIRTHKLPSTPEDPSRAILQGIDHFFPQGQRLEIIHGTTVGTNAFLERKGAKTLLVTTHGFEDVLFIGRQNRSEIYNLQLTRPAPIIPSSHCVGVKERLFADGTVRTPLGKTVGRRLRALCRKYDIASVAVCLLHSYANPSHEQAIADALAGLGLPITLSSELLPEFREYERTSTTVINAYLTPIIAAYIQRLQQALDPATALFIQQSNGAVLPAATTVTRAVQTILSGPAGGVQGAWRLAGQMGFDKIITFDMGGTSTDVALCDQGPSLTRDYHIDGFPVRTQVIDIHTVGAGGGSIAWLDPGGLIHVGPQSAGADPGPACYGIGNDSTVTDANLVLGRLPAALLGGKMPLDKQRAHDLLAKLGAPMAMSAQETALGIIQLVNAEMTRAIRKVSLERGHDPKAFALFSYGGASGLHCCALARELGIKKIVIPARAGVLSAQGMIMADQTVECSQTLFLTGDQLTAPTSFEDPSSPLHRALTDLTARAREQARELSAKPPSISIFFDLRYRGQSHELTIPLQHNWPRAFHLCHQQMFGYAMPENDLELTALRCTATIHNDRPRLPSQPLLESTAPVPQGWQDIIFDQGDVIRTPVLHRHNLLPGQRLRGPALCLDSFTTILLPPQTHACIDEFCNLIVVP